MTHPRSLEEAHATIAALEREIAERASPPRPPPVHRRWAALTLSMLGVFVLTGYLTSKPRHIEVMTVPAPPPSPPGDGELVWTQSERYSQIGPSFVDVDGDGARDLVTFMWHETREDRALWVVAIDRKTYAAKWRAGPLKARARDHRAAIKEMTPQEIVVSDAEHDAIRIDPKSGAMLLDGVRPNGPAFANDPRKPKCPSDGSLPCQTESSEGVEIAIKDKLHAEHVFVNVLTSTQSAEDHVTIAHAIFANEDARDYVAGIAPPKASVVWLEPLVPNGRVVDMYPHVSPNAWTAISSGRVLHVYQLVRGAFRIAARDVATGKLLYDVALGDLAEGDYLDSLSADGDEVFVVADAQLFVLDARTGAVSRRIRAL